MWDTGMRRAENQPMSHDAAGFLQGRKGAPAFAGAPSVKKASQSLLPSQQIKFNFILRRGAPQGGFSCPCGAIHLLYTTQSTLSDASVFLSALSGQKRPPRGFPSGMRSVQRGCRSPLRQPPFSGTYSEGQIIWPDSGHRPPASARCSGQCSCPSAPR